MRTIPWSYDEDNEMNTCIKALTRSTTIQNTHSWAAHPVNSHVTSVSILTFTSIPNIYPKWVIQRGEWIPQPSSKLYTANNLAALKICPPEKRTNAGNTQVSPCRHSSLWNVYILYPSFVHWSRVLQILDHIARQKRGCRTCDVPVRPIPRAR